MASRLAVRCGRGSIAPLHAVRPTHWPVSRRCFADRRRPDATILPGSHSERASDDIPAPPILSATPNSPATAPHSNVILPKEVPLMPPAPEHVKSVAPPPVAAIDNKTPVTEPVAKTTSSPPPPPPPSMPLPPKRTGRIRRTLTSLILLSVLGYAGGVYYALDNDNFHDFFTEYVPFGEDAVAYFEERNFRNRFPSRPAAPKSQEQIRGERKITIGKSSGVSAHIAEPTTSDLGQRGRHVSALDDNKASASEAQQQPSVASGREKTMAVEKAKDSAKGASSKSELNKSDVSKSKSEVKQSEPVKSTPSYTAEPTVPAETMSLVDHITVPDATEPLVQKAVKMVNDIITVVNSDPNATKYQTTLAQAKSQLLDVVAGISQLKSNISSEADMKVSDAHSEFDTAAKELVSRLEKEMQSQELRWREEYESERERLAQSYQDKLAAELDVVRKVAESRTNTTIVEQEIALRRQFAKQIQDRIETERNGRLARLEDLSASVAELQALSSQWNNVVETVTQTQHLHVALDAVRASIAKSDYPTPFLDELLALKEVSGDNKVVAAAVNSIPRAAYQDGVPSTAYLVDRYRRVASEVRKAALLPADAGVASHAASAVLSKFMFSKKDAAGLPAGDDVEAVLTRTEVLLEEGNLDAAVREMNGLRGWAGLLSKDWVAECRRVLETRQATDIIESEARLQSCLVN